MIPKDFVWGASTSAYQIEGAYREDGRGMSIWDAYCRQEGKIQGGENGDVACDHYHRYPEDVRLMKELGIHSYRFSLSWPRILPEGTGRVNEAGLDFYDRLVDALLEAGIEPCVTLYHWDLPLALHQKGGWLHPDVASAFGEYTQVAVQRLHDRVRKFITLNEPQCITQLGYGKGEHAPGFRTDFETQATVAHNLLLAHGSAAQAIRAVDSGCQVGIASTGEIRYPVENTEENRKAAYEANFRTDDQWGFSHHWYLDPMILGHYPQENLPQWAEAFLETVPPEDMETIAQPLNFLGVNLYNGFPVDCSGNPVKRPIGSPKTAMRWNISPKAMGYGLEFLYQRYGLPLYITENGCACNDRVYLDGKVHDPDRIDYTRRYLLEIERAMDAGVPVKGYYHWSFLDNFEWNNGYNERFGLVYVDYAHDLRRIPKDSYYWYQEVIRTGNI